MTFQWVHVLDLARHLAEMPTDEMRSDPESYYRTSVSRAYYACHTSVRDWMTDYTLYAYTSNGEGVHKHLINRVPTFIDRPHASSITRYMDSLRLMRADADYQLLPLSGNWDKSRALSVIEDAEYVLDCLGKSSPKP